MKWTWIRVVALYVTGALGLAARVAFAQGINPPVTSLVAVPTVEAPSEGLAMLVLFAVTTAVLVAIVKVSEFRKKREEKEIDLQIRIDEALLAIPGLLNSSVTPTVHVPFRNSAPVRIELSGVAPSRYLEQLALRVTAEVAARLRPNFSLVNLMFLAPSSGTRPETASVPERVKLVPAKGERPWQAAVSHHRS
jgi:hypothetical protein